MKILHWLLICFSVSTLTAADNQIIPKTKVLIFSASTREGSYNTMLAKEAAGMAEELGADVTFVSLKDYPVPIYEDDLERKSGLPNNAKRFRQLLSDHSAIIITTPEFNGSIPGILKNLIDWTSRNEQGQYCRLCYKDKKFAIMSASPGGGGGVRALIHLRAILSSLGGEVLSQQLALSCAHQCFDENGHLKMSDNRKDLKQEIQQLLFLTEN